MDNFTNNAENHLCIRLRSYVEGSLFTSGRAPAWRIATVVKTEVM